MNGLNYDYFRISIGVNKGVKLHATFDEKVGAYIPNGSY